jgi:hypothetical protein
MDQCSWAIRDGLEPGCDASPRLGGSPRTVASSEKEMGRIKAMAKDQRRPIITEWSGNPILE